MNIVLSFIGKLPNYIVDCVHQVRCFTDSPIYIIMNDSNSIFVEQLKKYNVNIINYADVIHYHFINIANQNISKFHIVHGLGDRKELFLRSLERFFLLHNLMKLKELKNCFFMELDNLIYDDPNNWLEKFSTKQLCYMYDNKDRCSSGIMYVKQSSSLTNLLEYFLQYIQFSNEFLNEMTCLYRYYEKNKDDIQLLPVYWKNESKHRYANDNFDTYNSIFDAAAIGVYLLGADSFHHNGEIKLGLHNFCSDINYTSNIFKWIEDDKGRKRPYILNGDTWLLINNLHVHSKALHTGLSLPLS